MRQASLRSSTYAGYLEIVIAATIWGTLGLVVRALPLTAELIVFYRVFFNLFAVLLVLFATRRIGELKVKKHRLLLLFSGIMLALNWISLFYAFKLTTIANAVLVTYTYPIMVALLAPIFLGEKLEFATIVSLILSVLGMVFIISPGNLSLQARDLHGILLALVSAATYAILVIAAKKMLHHLTSYAIMFYEALVVAIALSPFVFVQPGPATLSAWLLLALLGVVHGTLALNLYFSGLRVVKAQRASILTYLDPVSATVFAALFLGEKPVLLTVVGGVLIVAAGFNVVRKRARTQPATPD